MGLGCWAIGGPAWDGNTPAGLGEVDDEESVNSILCAVELGVNLFDTADIYGAGHSERVLGRALKQLGPHQRGSMVIATKFGHGYDETSRQVRGEFYSPDYIRQACEQSLKRLNTDHIDLYQFHLGAHPVEEIEQIIITLEELVQAGKIRTYGWSTDDPIRMQVFAKGPHCVASQFALNVLDDKPEMVELCDRHQLIGLNHFPLGMGLITNKQRERAPFDENDVRGMHGPGWVRYFKNGRPNTEYTAKIERIRLILTSNGRTLAQGALAWVWGRSPQMVPITGFRTVKQVEENATAMRFGPLTPDQMKTIDRILWRLPLVRRLGAFVRKIRWKLTHIDLLQAG